MSTVHITWCGLDLTVHGEYEPAEPDVGLMSDCYLVEEIYCEGARQWAFEQCDEHMQDIAELCLARIEQDRAEYRAEARAHARGIDL